MVTIMTNLLKVLLNSEMENTDAVTAVYRAVKLGIRLEENCPMFDEIIWERNHEVIAEILNKNNINEIIVTDTSTALMNTLLFFVREGFVISASYLEDTNNEFCSYRKGIRMLR